jgi:hypothetical protein
MRKGKAFPGRLFDPWGLQTQPFFRFPGRGRANGLPYIGFSVLLPCRYISKIAAFVKSKDLTPFSHCSLLTAARKQSIAVDAEHVRLASTEVF